MSKNQTGLILFLFPRANQAFRDKVFERLNVQDESTAQFREGVRQSVDDLRQLIYDRTVAEPSLETQIAAAQKRLDDLKAERPTMMEFRYRHPDPSEDYEDIVERYF